MEILHENHIPQRLARMADMITAKHRHQLGRGETAYDLVTCLRDQDKWNWSEGNKTVLTWGGAQPAGMAFMAGSAVPNAGRIARWMTEHADEMRQQVAFLLKEVDSILETISGLIASAKS